MGHVFISYAHKDSGFVDRLSQALRANGISIWVDRSQLLPGVEWSRSIEQALSDADAILFVVSPNSANSSWVQHEIELAILRSQTGNGKLVIPLLIGSPQDVPVILRTIQWVDFSHNFDEGLRYLVSSLPSSVRLPQAVPTLPLKAKGYFFLSFVEEDSEFVVSLRQFLQEQKYGYWDYLESERDYGLQFWREIEERIDKAAALLCILSPDWRASKWTPREFLYAEESQVPTFLLMARQMKPSLLTVGLTYIDFTHDQKKSFGKLERELRRKQL